MRRLTMVMLLNLSGCAACPGYVYNSEREGEAILAQANSETKVKTLEAQALKQSAIYQAEAEVERAKGVAQANKIIGDSLKDNEGYLRWLWIKGLEDQATKAPQIIYLPTEAGMPVLEATRHIAPAK